MLPNFLVVGAQKSGTTSLHNYLQTHPDVFLPAQKETKFFIEDRHYNKGIGFYESEYFSAHNGERAVGEVDPDYLYFEEALPRIAHELDTLSLKLIFILRNPAERAFSHYLMTYRRGLEPLSFEEAIEAEPERISRGYAEKMHFSYVSRGYYLRQIERFLEYMDRSQMLFLLTDDLKADPVACVQRVFSFLGVRDDFVPPNIGERFHRATVPRSVSLIRRIKGQGIEKRLVRFLIPSATLRQSLREQILRLNQTTPREEMVLADETRKRLIDVYGSENARLSTFIGRGLDHWDYVPDGAAGP